jgi:WD40 repeat protein
MQSQDLEKYRQRLHSRIPLIGGWLRRRAVRELAQDGSFEAVRALAGTVAHHPDPSSSAAALSALRVLAEDNNAEAQESLCRLAMENDHVEFRDEVLAAGYLPREESRRALFFFLTGQWEQYDSLDFDHSLLRGIYEAADDRLRRRIAAVARAAGRLEWVEVVSGGRRGRRLGAMTDREWRAALAVLRDHERWPEIWQLAQEAPPRWSAALVRQLRKCGWTPSEADRADFDELGRLAEAYGDPDFRYLLHCRKRLKGHRDEIRSLTFAPNGRLLASGCGDGSVGLWKIPDGKGPHRLKGHKGPVNCLAISPNGRTLVSGGRDGAVWLWQLPSADRAKCLQGHSQMVTCLAISPDGQTLATGSADSSIQLWSLPDGQSLKLVPGHDAAVLDLAISPDGRILASAGGDSMVRLWSLPGGRALATLQGHRNHEQDAVLCLAISPDGQLLASGGTDGVVKLWNLPDGNWRDDLSDHHRDANCLAISRDGKWLVSGGGDHNLKVWQLPAGRPGQTWEAHCDAITRLTISPDGNMLASISGTGLGQDASVRVWKIPEGRHVKNLYGHAQHATCLALSPNGQMLASGSGDRIICLWTPELHRLLSEPVRETSLKDLEWVRSVLADDLLPADERAALTFLEALVRRYRRHDIVVAEAGPRVIEVGAFDIEIEG